MVQAHHEDEIAPRGSNALQRDRTVVSAESSGSCILRRGLLFERLEVLFLVAAALGCMVTLFRAVLVVPLPYALDFAEGPLLNGSVRIAQGLSPYPPATGLPYIIHPYGPLPYFFGGLCVKLFGVSFTGPRVLVVISGIWCAALISLLVFHWGRQPLVSVGFGFLYLSRQLMTDFLPLFRVDLIGLAFALSGLYLFAKSRRWYLSIPFFVAALFCKFLLLSAPLACFLYCVFRKEARKAAWFAGGGLALGGMAFLWAQLESHGWFAFDTIKVEAVHPYNLANALNRTHGELTSNYFLVVLALALVYYLRSRPELALPFVYFGLSFLTLLGRGKLGAAPNYSLEWSAVLCCCAGVAYSCLRASSDIRSFVATLMPGALALMVIVNLHRPDPDPDKHYTECRQAYEFVKNHPGKRVLSENVGALVMAGKPLLVAEPFLWTQMVVRAGWPDTEIVDLIRSRQIDLVVLTLDVKALRNQSIQNRWPNSVAVAIERNYRLVHTFNCTDASFVYQPETPPD